MKGTFSLFFLYASFYLNFILDVCTFKHNKVLNMYLDGKIAILIYCNVICIIYFYFVSPSLPEYVGKDIIKEALCSYCLK